MIKGSLGYLKYLKLFGTLFLISCFTGLFANSVNAIGGTVVPVQTTVNSVYDNAFSMMVNGQGLFYTSYVGLGKQLVMSAPGRYFMWLYINGNIFPYIGSTTNLGSSWGWNEEGVPNNFLLCDSLSVGDSAPSNCVDYNYSDNVFLITRVFQNIDKRYYGDFLETSIGGWFGSLFCFSSSSIGRSVCFYSCSHTNCGSSSEYIGGVRTYKNLGTSYNLGTSFDNIPINLLTSFPGSDLINGGSQTTDGSFQMTGDLVIDSCTKQKALTWYECQGYTNNLCYSMYGNNTEIFNGQENGPYNDIEVPGKDIMSVYSDTRYLRRYGLTGESMSYNEWFKYWRKSYEVYKQNSDSINNPFIGSPVSLFMYFGQVDAYGLPYTNDSIVEYCILSEYQRHLLDQAYTGVAYNTVCNMSPIELVDCSIAIEHSDPVYGSTGTVGAVGSSWVGITNRSGYTDRPGGSSFPTLQTYNDGTSFENNFFNVLKSNFKYPSNSGSPLLPTYIILFLCGLILFRFMSH